MKMSKENSDNPDSMKKLFFRVLYSFIGSAFMLSGGYFLYWTGGSFEEFISTIIGVIFMASGFWMVYRLAYKPRDKMKISTKIAIIVIVMIWFATVNYLYFIFPNFLSPPPESPGPTLPPYLYVRKVDYEPNRYFVLDEKMETYPLFRLALDNMEVEKTRFGFIRITLEEMKKLEKIFIESGYLKYESKFYNISVFDDYIL